MAMLLLLLLLATAVLGSASGHPKPSSRVEGVQKDISLLDYGAVCDGVHPDTAAFNRALAAAGAAVRGDSSSAVVRVPARRTCLTGPFNITSDFTTLYLEADSVVKASDEPALWPVGYPLPTFGPRALFSAFVGFYSVNGSGIDGTGSLDMDGQAWHGGRLDPKNDYKNLPNFVMVHGSANVGIRGVSLLNGCNWNVHLVYSTHCTVDGIRIITPFKGTDGVDVDSSTHIVVRNSFISNGDDCIAIKSGFDCFGIQMNRPSTDILISNISCTHGGSIAVGSEMSGGVADVLITDCLMRNLSGPVLSYRWTQVSARRHFQPCSNRA
jgi:polygalacturonase